MEIMYVVHEVSGVSVKTTKELLFQVKPELNEFYEQLADEMDREDGSQ